MLDPGCSHVAGLIHARVACEIHSLWISGMDRDAPDSSRQVFSDIAPDGRGTAVRIRGNPNRPAVGNGVDNVGIARRLICRVDGIGKRLPNRCPAVRRRNRGTVESSNHVLASRNKVRWRGWVHAKRRKEAAGSIVVQFGRGDVDLFVGLSVESAKRTPTVQDGIGPGAPIRID